MSRTHHHGRFNRYWKKYYQERDELCAKAWHMGYKCDYHCYVTPSPNQSKHPIWAYWPNGRGKQNLFHHIFDIRPARTVNKILCKSILKLSDFDSFLPFLDYKIPHTYYW